MEALRKKRDEYIELITRRRRQIIVHSIIYYKLNDNIWTDHEWQEAANELVQLQKEYPHPIGFYDEDFKDFDASTGFHLTSLGWGNEKAIQLLNYEKEKRAKCQEK